MANYCLRKATRTNNNHNEKAGIRLLHSFTSPTPFVYACHTHTRVAQCIYTLSLRRSFGVCASIESRFISSGNAEKKNYRNKQARAGGMVLCSLRTANHSFHSLLSLVYMMWARIACCSVLFFWQKHCVAFIAKLNCLCHTKGILICFACTRAMGKPSFLL